MIPKRLSQVTRSIAMKCWIYPRQGWVISMKGRVWSDRASSHRPVWSARRNTLQEFHDTKTNKPTNHCAFNHFKAPDACFKSDKPISRDQKTPNFGLTGPDQNSYQLTAVFVAVLSHLVVLCGQVVVEWSHRLRTDFTVNIASVLEDLHLRDQGVMSREFRIAEYYISNLIHNKIQIFFNFNFINWFFLPLKELPDQWLFSSNTWYFPSLQGCYPRTPY